MDRGDNTKTVLDGEADVLLLADVANLEEEGFRLLEGLGFRSVVLFMHWQLPFLLPRTPPPPRPLQMKFTVWGVGV